MCLNTGTPKNINFSFETNGKLMALGVPVLKHFRVVDFPNSIDPIEAAHYNEPPPLTVYPVVFES